MLLASSTHSVFSSLNIQTLLSPRNSLLVLQGPAQAPPFPQQAFPGHPSLCLSSPHASLTQPLADSPPGVDTCVPTREQAFRLTEDTSGALIPQLMPTIFRYTRYLLRASGTAGEHNRQNAYPHGAHILVIITANTPEYFIHSRLF